MCICFTSDSPPTSSQVISVTFYSEHGKYNKFCSEALISAWGSFTCRESMTQDPWLYFPSKGSHTEDFYSLKKSINPGNAPHSSDMSPCNYDIFAKAKEPLRGTRYNTRDEIIHAIGRSIQNINKDGQADGVWRVPNIWQKMINKGTAILKVHKCCTPVNKAMSEILNFCHCFLSNLCKLNMINFAE